MRSRRSHDAVICVYDDARNIIETVEHRGDFQRAEAEVGPKPPVRIKGTATVAPNLHPPMPLFANSNQSRRFLQVAFRWFNFPELTVITRKVVWNCCLSGNLGSALRRICIATSMENVALVAFVRFDQRSSCNFRAIQDESLGLLRSVARLGDFHLGTPARKIYVHLNVRRYLWHLWARVSRKFRRKPQQWSWTFGLDVQSVESRPRRRSRHGDALKQIERPQEPHSMRWECKACRYMKHFTRPVTLEAAGRCPRCKSTEFKPVL